MNAEREILGRLLGLPLARPMLRVLLLQFAWHRAES